MRVWAVANQKGGVGKTTTVVSLAGHLSVRGCKTLVVDMDPHGSMTSYFGLDPDSIERSLYQLFQKDISSNISINDLIYKTKFENLYLVPASTALATLDRQLGQMDGMGLTVAKALASVFSEYHNAIIDCPPQLGVLMVNALAACEQLIIPVQTEFLALKGLERMYRTLQMLQNANKRDLKHIILPTMYDKRTRASLSTLKILHQRYPDKVFKGYIPVDTLFRDASKIGVPLPICKPHDRGSVAYGLFLDHMQQDENPHNMASLEVG